MVYDDHIENVHEDYDSTIGGETIVDDKESEQFLDEVSPESPWNSKNSCYTWAPTLNVKFELRISTRYLQSSKRYHSTKYIWLLMEESQKVTKRL